MDVINNLELMIPKMRKQLYLKKAYSLDLFYEAIEKQGQYLNIKDLDTFLAKFGIFLKSQEITALLNNCRHSENEIDLIRMVYIFRTKIPEDIIKKLNLIFDKISEGQPSMDVEEALLHLDVTQHPLLEMFQEDYNKVKESVIKGLRLIIGDKKMILREEFLEFHFNIFWIIPDFLEENFRKQISLMWGIKKLK
jgi:hypothetical protein